MLGSAFGTEKAVVLAVRNLGWVGFDLRFLSAAEMVGLTCVAEKV